MIEKEDPGRLELRAKPRPVVRLNRRMIAVLAGALMLAVLLALMWGLRKPAPSQAPASPEKRNVERVARAEGLGRLRDDSSMGQDNLGLPNLISSEPTQQSRKQAFVDRKADSRLYASADLQAPRSPYQLTGGIARIPAALITGIKSDLPGDITAMVTENVFDTATGRYLLIPQGSWLYGQYDSEITYGHRRVLMCGCDSRSRMAPPSCSIA